MGQLSRQSRVCPVCGRAEIRSSVRQNVIPADNARELVSSILSCLCENGQVSIAAGLHLQDHMSDNFPRILCRVPTSKEVTMYTCARCAWTFRVDSSDMTAGQAAFDAHRCEGSPREE